VKILIAVSDNLDMWRLVVKYLIGITFVGIVAYMAGHLIVAIECLSNENINAEENKFPLFLTIFAVFYHLIMLSIDYIKFRLSKKNRNRNRNSKEKREKNFKLKSL